MSRAKKSKALQRVEEGSWIVGQPPPPDSLKLHPSHPQLKEEVPPLQLLEVAKLIRLQIGGLSASRSACRTMSAGVCGPIRKHPYKDYKQRSMLFCRSPCSRRVCACVCESKVWDGLE